MEDKSLAAELEKTLAEYAQAVVEVERKRKPFDGFLGLGSHPGNAPCHEMMDKRVEALCGEAAEVAPEEIAALVWAVFRAEENWRGPEYARLMLLAIHRHTLPLLPKVAEGELEGMKIWYEKKYPRRKRVPVQDQVVKAFYR